MAPPIMSPAKAEIRVSRVAVRREPSCKAPSSAAAMALGGASESLCRWIARAQSSNITSAAAGSSNALARSGIIAPTP